MKDAEFDDVYMAARGLDRLDEATAREVYDKFMAGKMSENEYFSLLKMDPTAKLGDTLELSGKGKFTDWLVTKYLKSEPTAKARFLTEDCEQIKAGLTVFEKLTRNKDGVAQLSTMTQGKADVKNVSLYSVEEIRGLTGQKKVAANEFLGKKDEDKIDVLIDSPQFKVVSPRTHAADRKWGTGTNWCTATSNPTWYKKYTKDGPLFIIVEKKPDGKFAKKWQYHEQSEQFMDSKDHSVSRRQWFESFASRGPEWEDAVDSVAEALESHGCKKFSLDALFTENPYVEKILLGKEPEEVAFSLARGDYVKTYILTEAFLHLSMDDFLEVYDYAGNPSDSPALGEMLSLSLDRLPEPRAETALRLLRFVDSERPDLVPRSLVKSMTETGLLMASFETFRLGMMTLERIPQDRRFVAFRNALLSESGFKQPVQRFLSKADGDDTLLEILAMVLKDDPVQLAEARQRPTGMSVRSALDRTREKQTKDGFLMLMTSVLEPIAGAFKKSWKFIQSNGTVVDFDGDDADEYVVKSPVAIIAELLNDGNRIQEEERQTLSFALGSLGKPENFDEIQSVYQDVGGKGLFTPFPHAIRQFFEKVDGKLDEERMKAAMSKAFENPELFVALYSLWKGLGTNRVTEAFKECDAYVALVKDAKALLTDENVSALVARVSKKPNHGKVDFVGPFLVIDTGHGYSVQVVPDLAILAGLGIDLAKYPNSPLLGFLDVYARDGGTIRYCDEAMVALTNAGIRLGEIRHSRVYYGNNKYVPVGFSVLGKKRKEEA